MRLVLCLLLVMAAVGCDKTIEECRTPANPQPALSPPTPAS